MSSSGSQHLKAALERIRLRSSVRVPNEPEQTTVDEEELDVDRPQSIYLTQSLADVEPDDVQWLWRNYLPLGKVTTLDGSPGVGKSTIGLDLAARVSTGRAMPDGSRSDLLGPADVIVASAEDGAADTILPRLLAAGGDPTRIHLLGMMPTRSGRASVEQWSVPKHVPRLKAEILRVKARLVLVDPLSAFLSAGINMLQDQSMREALGPLARVAEEVTCAILANRHFTKTGGTNPVHRGGGSISVIGQARSGLIVAGDPEDPTGRRRVLAVAKSNLAVLASSLGYEVVSDNRRKCSRISWGQASHYRAHELLVEPANEEDRSERQQIADLLRRATEEDPILCSEARAMVRTAGFQVSDRTISRAATKSAGLKARTTNSYPCQRYWAREDQALPGVDTGVSDHDSDRGVPTDPTRENEHSGLSVDSPKELSTLSNGKAGRLTEGGLGDLPAAP